MRGVGTFLLGIGLIVGVGTGIAILGHLFPAAWPWLLAVGIAKLGVVASGALMASGAVLLRLSRRREARALGEGSVH